MSSNSPNPAPSATTKSLASTLLLFGTFLFLSTLYTFYVNMNYLGFFGITTGLVLATGLIGTGASLFVHVRDARANKDHCHHCGYPRTGLNPTSPCPECGQQETRP